jgi:hypothetical protein
MTDWLLRVSCEENLRNLSRYRIWGIQSTTPYGSHFLQNAKTGDRVWFVNSCPTGRLLAVATYCSHNVRDFWPLVSTTMTSQEPGWTDKGPDTEIHYTDLYGLEQCDLLTHLVSTLKIVRYNSLCQVDLPAEYTNIVRYSKVTTAL